MSFCLWCFVRPLTCRSDLPCEINLAPLFHVATPIGPVTNKTKCRTSPDCAWKHTHRTHPPISDWRAPTNACPPWHASVSHSELIPTNLHALEKNKQQSGVVLDALSANSRLWLFKGPLQFLNDALLFLRPTRKTPRGLPRWRASRFSCRSSWRASRCRKRWPSLSTRGNSFVSDKTVMATKQRLQFGDSRFI